MSQQATTYSDSPAVPAHEAWIDLARALAAVGVVLLHTLSGVPAEALLETGDGRLAIWMLIRIVFGRFAVPLFLIISGYLMLDPARSMPTEKLKAHLVRLAKIYVMIGLPIALLYSLGTSGAGFFSAIGQAVCGFIVGTHRYHLWFIWELICFYALLPLFRPFVERATQKQWTFILGLLFVLSLVMPTFCDFFAIDYYKLSPFRTASAFYFLLGGYFRMQSPKDCKRFVLPGVIGLVAYCLVALAHYAAHGYPAASLEDYTSPFAALWAVAIFCSLRLGGENPQNNVHPQAIKLLSQDSLGIYLFHPLATGLLYRILGITPADLPFGSALIFLLIFIAFGIAATELWRRLPRVGKLL